MRTILIALCVLFVSAPCYSASCCSGGVCQPAVKVCAPAVVEQGTVSVEATAIVERPQPIRHLIHRIIHGKPVAVVEAVPAAPAACAPAVCDPAKLPDIQGPMPGPHPGPGPQPFHGGGYGGGYGGFYRPYVNPFNYIAPIVVNYSTEPRMIPNPLNGGIPQMMTPGYWQAQPGAMPPYAWVTLPMWPLLGSKADAAATEAANVEAIPVVHFFREHKPVRHLIHRIFHGKS